MPRKTKEQKELENEKKIEKKTSITKKISEVVKTVAAKSTTKKTNSKSTSTKSTAKKVSSKAESSKSTTKKASSKTDTPKTATKSTAKTAKTTKANTTKTAKTAKKSNAKASTTKSVTKKANSKSANTKNSIKKPTIKKTSTSKITLKKVNNSKKKVDIVEYYDLPYRYNQTIVKVLAQTPTNLFIYWDISDKDRKNFELQYGKNFFETTKPVLIVYNTTLNYKFEVEINDFANSWYLHVPNSKCDYKIELGRRPISKTEQINVDYIYIATSNQIESPNNRILFNKDQKILYFRNIKTGEQTEKSINTFSFIQSMGKIYNIYDMYKAIYKGENIEKIYDLSNPSSGNPSSGSLSSKFK